MQTVNTDWPEGLQARSALQTQRMPWPAMCFSGGGHRANLDQPPILHADSRETCDPPPPPPASLVFVNKWHPTATTLHPAAGTGPLPSLGDVRHLSGLCDGPELTMPTHSTNTFNMVLPRRAHLC